MLLNFISSSSSLRLLCTADILPAVTLSVLKIWSWDWEGVFCLRLVSFVTLSARSDDLRMCVISIQHPTPCMPHNKLTKTPMITTKTSAVKSEEKMLRCNQLKSSALCDKEGQIGWVCLWMEGDDSISFTALCSSFSPITADGRAAPLLGRDRGGGNAHSRVNARKSCEWSWRSGASRARRFRQTDGRGGGGEKHS